MLDTGMAGTDIALVPALYIIGNKYHWVLDADLTTIGQNSTVVQLWEHRQTANQTWLIEPARGDLYKLRCPVSGRVLDADMIRIDEDRCRVQLYDDLGGDNQLWRFLCTTDGGCVIRNLAGGEKVLDADLDRINQLGTPIQLYHYVPGNSNQHWGFRCQ